MMNVSEAMCAAISVKLAFQGDDFLEILAFFLWNCIFLQEF